MFMFSATWRLRCAGIFLTASGLAACGGGGGGDNAGTSTNQRSSGSLTVTVTANGGEAVPQDSGIFYVPDPSQVTLTCNIACNAPSPTNNSVTLSNVSTHANGWSGTLDFANAASGLTVNLVAQDGSTVPIALRPVTAKGTSASWSMGSYNYSRRDSTQDQSSGTSGPSSAMVVGSTAISNCGTGPYECSTISVHWYGHVGGTFTIDPNFLSRTTKQPGTAWVNAKWTGGRAPNAVIANCTPVITLPTNEQYYNTDYRPTSGTIRVTLGTDGLFRVTTDTPLTGIKQPDSENTSLCIRSVAPSDAPASVSIQLNGIF